MYTHVGIDADGLVVCWLYAKPSTREEVAPGVTDPQALYPHLADPSYTLVKLSAPQRKSKKPHKLVGEVALSLEDVPAEPVTPVESAEELVEAAGSHTISILGAPAGTYTKVRTALNAVLGGPALWDYSKPTFAITATESQVETLKSRVGSIDSVVFG